MYKETIVFHKPFQQLQLDKFVTANLVKFLGESHKITSKD